MFWNGPNADRHDREEAQAAAGDPGAIVISQGRAVVVIGLIVIIAVLATILVMQAWGQGDTVTLPSTLALLVRALAL